MHGKPLILITKCLVFACLIGLLCAVLLFFSPPQKNYFFNSHIQKFTRLQTLKTKKLVFLGGSNLLFGLSSQAIENETKYSVVNMGLNAGVGLYLMASSVKDFMQPGDIIVLSLEYEYLKDSIYGSGSEAELSLIDPRLFRFYNGYQTLNFLRYFPYAFQKRTLNLFTIAPEIIGYQQDQINEMGDNQAHWRMANRWTYQKSKLAPIPSEIPAVTKEFLASFSSEMKAKGVRVFYSWAPLPLSRYKDNQSQIESLYRNVAQIFPDRVVGNPKNYIFPDQAFFDSEYHLLLPSALNRSLRVSEQLRGLISNDF